MISFLRCEYYQPGYHGVVGPRYLIEYKLISDDQSRAAVTACPEGVRFSGVWPVIGGDDIATLEEQIARARVQALHLADNPVAPLTEGAIDRILAPLPIYEATE